MVSEGWEEMPHGAFNSPICVCHWLYIYGIITLVQLYITLIKFTNDLDLQFKFNYVNLNKLLFKMGRGKLFWGARKRKLNLFQKNNQLAKKVKNSDFNTLDINNDNIEPMPSTSSEGNFTMDVDSSVKPDGIVDDVLAETGHKYNTRSTTLFSSSRLKYKTDEHSLLEGMRLLKNTKVIQMYNDAIKKHHELEVTNNCAVPEFSVKELKWGVCWKQIVYCTKCGMETDQNKLYDEVQTGKRGPKPAVTNLNMAVCLQDTSIGKTKIRHIVTAMDMPSPALNTIQKSANLVAETTINLNKADMSAKIKQVLDSNKRKGGADELSVGLDTRYDSIGIASRKKPGQAASQGIGLAVETLTDKKYIVGMFMQNKLCWTGAWLRNRGFDVECPGGHAECTANLSGAAPISEYDIGYNIGRGFNLERVLVKYATTDGDGRSAEGLQAALKLVTPLWRVERLADTIHLGQSQFKYSMKAAFSSSMFSPMGPLIQTKVYQYKKGLSLDIKARSHVILNSLMTDMQYNLPKMQNLLPSILKATMSCYAGDCSMCKKYSYSCSGGASKNWWTRSFYLQQYGIHGLDMDEKDTIIIREILKMKLSVSAIETMKFNTNTNKNEASNRGLSASLPKNVTFSRNANGRAHSAVHRMNNGVGESTMSKIESVGGHLSPRAKRTLQQMQNEGEYQRNYKKQSSTKQRQMTSRARQLKEHFKYKGRQSDYRKGQLDPRPNIPLEGDHCYAR